MFRYVALLLLICSPLYASNPVNGTFEAKEVCPAYISKNSKSNPDNLTVQPNQHYELKEINKIPPDWVRIELTGSQHSLRWVNASCGVTEYTEKNTNTCNNNPGMADSYVLALSSQAGFCETYGYEAGKPECKKLPKSSYQANHLTLHGLWPNQNACGQNYGFCDAAPRSNHCAYSPLTFAADVAENLKKFMPSYYYGSCLERHEWYKHGSCQVLSPDSYFSLAMRLTVEADKSIFGQYLTEHNGQVVKLAQIKQSLSDSFGKNNVGKVYIGCKNGVLVDIFFQLPALIPATEPLEALINKAPDYQYKDSCPNNVIISSFSKGAWL